MAAEASCSMAARQAAQLDRLTVSLADRTESNDMLQLELRSRPAEQERLVELLRHKEVQILRLDGLSTRHGCLLRAARGRVRLNLVLCACREWRRLALRARWRRDRDRYRAECVVADLRHACGLLRGALLCAATRAARSAFKRWVVLPPRALLEDDHVLIGTPRLEASPGLHIPHGLVFSSVTEVASRVHHGRAFVDACGVTSRVGSRLAAPDSKTVAGSTSIIAPRRTRPGPIHAAALPLALQRLLSTRLDWSWRRLRRAEFQVADAVTARQPPSVGFVGAAVVDAVEVAVATAITVAFEGGRGSSDRSDLLEMQARIEAMDCEDRNIADLRLPSELQWQSLVGACGEAQTRLARATEWDSLAVARVEEMAQHGGQLQSQQEQLRRRLRKARATQITTEEENHFSQMLLDQAKKATETLQQRVSEHEQLLAGSAASFDRTMRQQMEDRVRHDAVLNAVRTVLSQVGAADDQHKMAAMTLGTGGLMCESLLESATRSRAFDDLMEPCRVLEAQLRETEAEAAAARQAGDEAREESRAAAMRIAMERKALLSRSDALQQDAWIAARGDLEAATAACERLRLELDHRTEHLDKLQSSRIPNISEMADGGGVREVDMHAMDSDLFPHPRELSAYAAIVDKLQDEVQHEREERTASENSLRGLQSAYRLLLARTHAG